MRLKENPLWGAPSAVIGETGPTWNKAGLLAVLSRQAMAAMAAGRRLEAGIVPGTWEKPLSVDATCRQSRNEKFIG